MSTFALDKLLFQLNADQTLFDAFRADPQSVVKRYDLSEAERSAVLGHSLSALHQLGANGYVLVGFAAHLGLFQRGRATAAQPAGAE